MRLYYSPGACSLSPHIVLREAGIPVELELVSLNTHKTKSGADFYGINPKGYVPALELADGSILTEGVCARGATEFGKPCRYKLFSPSDSPWSDRYSSAAS